MDSFSDDEQRAFEEMTSGVELNQSIGESEAAMRAAIGSDRYDEIQNFNDAVADTQLDSSRAIVKVLEAKAKILLHLRFLPIPAFLLGLGWSVFYWIH
jgi:hypothetical protein